MPRQQTYRRSHLSFCREMAVSQAAIRVYLTILYLHGMDGHTDGSDPRATLPSVLNVAAGKRACT